MSAAQPVITIDHPLARQALTILRDVKTDTLEFRRALTQAGEILCLAATRDLGVETITVATPLRGCRSKGVRVKEPVLLVPVLRAGLGFVEPFLKWLPQASVGHLGLVRNEVTLQPESYYSKLPKIAASHRVFLLDPMLATGGSAVAALKMLKQAGAKKVTLVCLLASPQGVKAVRKAHADVTIYTCAVDPKLNDRGYIVPGLGDAGDRLFRTGGSL
jgi:uracil phosphoribosyltransferase